MSYTYVLSAFLLSMLTLFSPAHPAGAVESRPLEARESQPAVRAAAPDPDAAPKDSESAARHWKQARAYQKGMRLELARQEYLLALANCRTEETRDRLQRELQIVDLQLRTLR